MLWVVVGLLVQGPSEWERFGPGSYAEYATTGKQDGADVRTTEKALFREATSTDVVISMETVDASGGRSTVDMRYPLPQRAVPKEDEGTKTGDETLTIDGKTFECEIYERKGIRRWLCASAAANRGVLKSESIAGTVRLSTKVLKLAEKIAVAGTTLTCWMREEVTEIGDQKTTRRTWMCDSVPGAVVRTEIRQVKGASVVVDTVTNLTSFHVVKK
ncbi:MAG TPA: hypothetical protein VFS19_07375 [Planctomycetota bacterium]|nr:hypothetical protein [Planctomycetota bacterium]